MQAFEIQQFAFNPHPRHGRMAWLKSRELLSAMRTMRRGSRRYELFNRYIFLRAIHALYHDYDTGRTPRAGDINWV